MDIERIHLDPDDLGAGVVLFDDGRHRYVWLGLLEDEGDGAVQVNQYAVENDGRVCLLDPGGVLTFAQVVASLGRHVELGQVDHIFYSHQDPDVCSGAALWMQVTPAQVHLAALWTRFLPHFGQVDFSRVRGLPDAGGTIEVGSARLEVLPAHFLHSVGNYVVFDPISGFLFSGDIGASVFPDGQHQVFVDDFDAHLPFTEGFHRRYMSSRAACRRFVDLVRPLEPRAIVPQHGAIYRGPAVGRFLDWLADLECGVDNLDALYGPARRRR